MGTIEFREKEKRKQLLVRGRPVRIEMERVVGRV